MLYILFIYLLVLVLVLLINYLFLTWFTKDEIITHNGLRFI